MLKNYWDEIKCEYVDENSLCRIEVWKKGIEQGTVVAWVDMLSGRVVYRDPSAKMDAMSQKMIDKVSDDARKKHPYSLEQLENLLISIVDYECEELESGVDVEQNLYSMGFSEDEMIFFGFPPKVD